MQRTPDADRLALGLGAASVARGLAAWRGRLPLLSAAAALLLAFNLPSQGLQSYAAARTVAEVTDESGACMRRRRSLIAEYTSRSAVRMIFSMMRTLRTGCLPDAVSAESITADVPS